MNDISSIDMPQAEQATLPPLVVDLDGTLIATDTLDESFIAVCFREPWRLPGAIFALLFVGIAAFKEKLVRDWSTAAALLPYRQNVLDWLNGEKARGREIHLVTAADRRIAEAVAAHLDLFDSVMGSEGGVNLKGEVKAARLVERFPQGFAYLGDSRADVPVWRCAKAVLIVEREARMAGLLRARNISVAQAFPVHQGGFAAWLRALRPHQWSKNVLVLVPVLLAWGSVTTSGVLATLAAMALLCLLASLTYLLNDLADLDADRRHWSKRNRPFASGALPIRHGLLAVAFGVPLVMGLALWLSISVWLVLVAYLVITLCYSFGGKRVPLLDTFIVAFLFTLRIVLGIVAADVPASPWLLAFSLFFFFSLATAKRHAELLRTEEKGQASGRIYGRGYHVEDKEATLIFGIGSGLVAVDIMIQFLMNEIMMRPLYAAPHWMWGVPPVIFLWLSRIWLLAHRGRMTDDPVVFAIRDRLSMVLGAIMALFFLLAVL